jgi:hypothetical protein
MKCIHCGSEGKIQVLACIEAPSELAHQFSKTNMKRKDVFFRGVLWETMDFICGNPNCQRLTDGYGNYVSNLKKENERLKKELAELKSNYYMDCKS